MATGKRAAEYTEICSILQEVGFEDDVVEIFRNNRIDKETFLDLQNEDLVELNITALGDRKRINKLKTSLRLRMNVPSETELESATVLHCDAVDDRGDRSRKRKHSDKQCTKVDSSPYAKRSTVKSFQYGPGDTIESIDHESTTSYDNYVRYMIVITIVYIYCYACYTIHFVIL